MQSLETARIQSKVVRVLAISQVLSGVGVAGTVAAGSLLVSSISQSETLAGLAQTTSVLGAAAMALPLSRLTQRGGRRLGLSVGYFVGGLGALLAVIGGTNKILFLMLCGTFMLGASSAAGYQARFAAVDLATNESRSRQLSFVVWGSTIGAVAGPNLMQPSGNLAEHLGLPRLAGPYVIAATSLALVVFVVRLFLRPDPYLTAIDLNEARNVRHPVLPARQALALIRKNPSARFAIAAIAIGHVAMVSVMSMTPIHMSHYDITLTIIGLVISVHILGMYAFSPLVGYMSDKLGRVRVIQIGVLILLSSSVVSGTSGHHDSVSLGIGLFLLGLGWSCTLIAGSALLSESMESHLRPSSQGASDLVMNLSGAGGGAIAGVIIGTLGYGWLCFFAAIPVAYLGVRSLGLKPVNV